MKYCKGRLSLAWALIFIFTLIMTACSSKLSDFGLKQETNTGETTKINTAAADLKPYQIDWYFIGSSEPTGLKEVEDAINAYLKDKINATVKFNIPDWVTYENKVSAMIMAGQKFDICLTANWLMNYTKFAQDGAFVELDQYLDKELKPCWDALTAKMGTEFLNGSMINGIHYGIPSAKEAARHWGFVYNKDLADKYNFDMSTVKKFEDIEPMLKVIKENEITDSENPLNRDKYIVPLFKDGNMNLGFIPWNPLNPDRVGVFKDGRWVNQYETYEYRNCYNVMRDWYLKGYLQKDVATAKDGPVIRQEGRFFCFPVNLKPGYAAEQQSRITGARIDQIDVTEPVITNNETMGALQAISKCSKDPQRAAMFLNLVNTDPVLINMIAYGIENKNYKKIEESRISVIPDSGYGPDDIWKFGNQYLLCTTDKEDPNKYKNFESYNKSAKPVEELGFIFNNGPVINEVDACDSIISEYQQVLKVGAVDPATMLPEFIQKLKEAGSDKIVEEMNRQWDIYKTSKKAKQ